MFLYLKIYLFVCIYIHVCVRVYHMSVSVKGQNRVGDFLELELYIGSCELAELWASWPECWEPNCSPLDGQEMLLTTATSLWSLQNSEWQDEGAVVDRRPVPVSLACLIHSHQTPVIHSLSPKPSHIDQMRYQVPPLCDIENSAESYIQLTLVSISVLVPALSSNMTLHGNKRYVLKNKQNPKSLNSQCLCPLSLFDALVQETM